MMRVQLRPGAETSAERSSAEDDLYDDAKDHERCPDCKGSGYYVGLIEKYHCPTCDGSGWR